MEARASGWRKEEAGASVLRPQGLAAARRSGPRSRPAASAATRWPKRSRRSKALWRWSRVVPRRREAPRWTYADGSLRVRAAAAWSRRRPRRPQASATERRRPCPATRWRRCCGPRSIADVRAAARADPQGSALDSSSCLRRPTRCGDRAPRPLRRGEPVLDALFAHSRTLRAAGPLSVNWGPRGAGCVSPPSADRRVVARLGLHPMTPSRHCNASEP